MGKIETIKDFKNELLGRRELKVVAEAEKNPGFANAAKIIADEFKAKEDLIVVKEVKSKFGRNTFLIDALIYYSAEDKEKVEPKKRVKKTDAAGGAK